MPTQFNNLLISDIIPRTYIPRQRLEASFTPRHSNYDRPLNTVLPSIPSPQRSMRVLFHPSLKYVGGLVVVVAVLLFVIGGQGGGSAPITAYAISPTTQNETKQAVVSYGLPARLKIPKLNIDTTVEHLGLTSKVEMATPKDPAATGWFKLGPRPGEIGSSVISGHYGYKDHLPAVFDALGKLKKGDRLYVEDDNGATITFVVQGSRKYDPKADTTDVFGANDGKAHLNLITCQGAWNKTQKSYSNRLVVFADRE